MTLSGYQMLALCIFCWTISNNISEYCSMMFMTEFGPLGPFDTRSFSFLTVSVWLTSILPLFCFSSLKMQSWRILWVRIIDIFTLSILSIWDSLPSSLSLRRSYSFTTFSAVVVSWSIKSSHNWFDTEKAKVHYKISSVRGRYETTVKYCKVLLSLYQDLD